ncbi:scyllo-inositol 2-dehydrogenase (NAD(+)) [Paenibacillus sp. CECT 9249]|uniref:Gfo/Idh/MocA family protein n=2 Tax=unclassified Paenibacillus TaxID=185978 RepID=UPI001E61BEEB|nr:Gfo/Idh/MocA family oxidoreductase [Paenibacillus sp. CECT 9249]CAH0118929.1 scyllo-inositol 2-dehydrogenase (NAD(+)) [Paenibacillus sp. CECT 9249]
MDKIRIGILGVGRFGRLHLHVLQQLPNCEVVAISDLNEDLLQQVSEKYGIPHTYRNPEEMMKSDLDVIDIVSDESTHGTFAIQALEHGKHVFIEKPIATTVRDAERIYQLSRERGKQVMVGNISRFAQPYYMMKKSIEAGALGEIGHIRAKRDFSRDWFQSFGKRVHPVYESGIHDLDLILWFADSACQEVYAVERSLSGNRYPDLFTATLTFANGIVATLESAWLVPRKGPRNLTETLELDGTIDAHMEIVGTKGSTQFGTLNTGLSLWSDEEIQVPDYVLWPTEHDGIGGAIRAELQHFTYQVRKGEESRVAPLLHSVEALKIADAIVRSGQDKTIVRL